MFQSTQNSLFLSAFLALATGLSIAGQTCAQSTSAQVEFPYQALVLRDGADVHSGPGQVLYGTEKLKQGTAIEVYRHDPGGWCAIRPTPDSFGLVPESTLQMVGEGVGKIVIDGTRAWVGTKLGPVEKPLWQVKLKKDELVEVIGQVSWPHAEGHSTIWYQIAPPAGEFRWIKMSDIQLPASVRSAMSDETNHSNAAGNGQVRSLINLDPTQSGAPQRRGPFDAQAELAASSAIEMNSMVQQASMQTELSSSFSTTQNNPTHSIDSTNRGWRQSTRPIQNRTANLGTSSSYDRNRKRMSRNNTYTGSATINSSFGKSPDLAEPAYGSDNQRARAPSIRVADADLTLPNLARSLDAARDGTKSSGAGQSRFSVNHSIDQMANLELQLTNEMLKNDPGQWRLEDLELQAANIFRTSNDINQRNSANQFLTKIENCREIRSGYQNGSAGNGRNATALGQNPSRPIGTGVSADIELGTKYDAHGWLNQMIRDGGQSQPEYVLQDANGKVTHHVAPIQGMNLHRFLKSHVGIVGQRGYHNRLKLDHVTAHQIVELEKRP